MPSIPLTTEGMPSPVKASRWSSSQHTHFDRVCCKIHAQSHVQSAALRPPAGGLLATLAPHTSSRMLSVYIAMITLIVVCSKAQSATYVQPTHDHRSGAALVSILAPPQTYTRMQGHVHTRLNFGQTSDCGPAVCTLVYTVINLHHMTAMLMCRSELAEDQNNKRKRFSDEQLAALTDLADEANWSLLSVGKEVREQFCSKHEISKVCLGTACLACCLLASTYLCRYLLLRYLQRPCCTCALKMHQSCWLLCCNALQCICLHHTCNWGVCNTCIDLLR